ncbi:hypothetical protein SAMN05216241_101207 [Limimonas halophila]|uniref:Lipoprotein n=1 Tax=Limimonas halophila TaxID=1082479 RepID=A0A1G7LER3_9PROT|nr:hypothetical protein [Limimonas halophila]SDF47459.1 hypothetical protein SAMN05216241_101207 [Limimonas halophila]
MRHPTRAAAGRAVAAVLMAGLLTSCDHVAKEMETGIEKAVGVPQPERVDQRDVLNVYCYSSYGYGPAGTRTCYRAPLGPEHDNRLMGSLYHGQPAR